MKATLAWHSTPLGRVLRFLGGIQLAVPVLVLVALALAWGTYIESTVGAKQAKAAVYGSSWFMALMGLVCVSLVFAVITRFPWRLRHVGFITVHASLVTLIVAGFWSLFGRIEGRLVLEQGHVSDTLETEEETLELVEHQAGKFNSLGRVGLPGAPGHVVLGDYTVHISERWQNSTEHFDVVDGGPEVYRAVEVSLAPNAPHGFWIGDEARGGPARLEGGLVVRVLGAGVTWTPPAPSAEQAEYSFTVGGSAYPLAAEGQDAVPGWKIASIRRFKNAITREGSVVEAPGEGDNPAISVLITDGQGTTERHTAFRNFPDVVLAKVLEGPGASGARLGARPGPTTQDTLVIHGEPPGLRVACLGRDGSVTQLEHAGPLPWAFDFGGRRVTLLQQLTHAQQLTHYTRAPDAKEHRPAVVVSVGDSAPTPLPWKGTLPVTLPGRPAILRYGPRTVNLPFALRLEKFHKRDYPGTEMAMAYESDVAVLSPGGGPETTTKIFMNNPLEHSGWKVYQSGFVGDTVSIFSVMKDPGLGLTYIASIGLCLGIVITFYSRKLSWGHPGIPGPMVSKEIPDATLPVPLEPAPLAADGQGQPSAAGVDGAIGVGAGAGRRAGDAARLVRA